MSEKDDAPRVPGGDRLIDLSQVDLTQVLKNASNPKRIADFNHQEEERLRKQMKEQIDQVRREALAAFVPRRNGEYVCPGCAAVVTDPERHLDWHGALAVTAAEAHEGAWRGRPIG